MSLELKSGFTRVNERQMYTAIHQHEPKPPDQWHYTPPVSTFVWVTIHFSHLVCTKRRVLRHCAHLQVGVMCLSRWCVAGCVDVFKCLALSPTQYLPVYLMCVYNLYVRHRQAFSQRRHDGMKSAGAPNNINNLFYSSVPGSRHYFLLLRTPALFLP